MSVNKIEKTRERVRVISLLPDVCSFDMVVDRILRLVEQGEGYVCFSTVHMVMESYDDPSFGAKVNGANLIVTDGMPLVWMQKMQGRKAANRVRANDLMIRMLTVAAEKGLKVGFYGGKQEVIDAIRERAERELPSLLITYAYSPPFRPLTQEEDSEIVAELETAAPDILFMGLGCPKQENWMADHRGRVKAVMLGVGASFDFYAGNVKESPEWLGKLGLEWLYRLTQEPKRLWRRYLFTNSRFVVLAIGQLLKLGPTPRNGSEPPAVAGGSL